MDSDVIYEPQLAAPDDPAPGRSRGRLGHRLHQGGQPPGELPDPVHRLRVHHRAGGRAAEPEGARRRSPAWPAARSCTRGPTSRRSAAGSTPTTLAEDTVTTFETQLAGQRVIFEPHATVWAEEPGSIVGAVEAAAALGPRQHPGHPAVQAALVPAPARQPAGQRQLRPALVLPAAAAGVHDLRLGLAGHPVLHRLPAGLAGLPRAVDHQRAHLRVHHLLLPDASTRDGAGTCGGRAHVPRRDQRDHHARGDPARCRCGGSPTICWPSSARRRHAGTGRRGHRAVQLSMAGRVHGRRLPREGRRDAVRRPVPQPAADLRRRLRPAAVRGDLRRLRQGDPAGRRRPGTRPRRAARW